MEISFFANIKENWDGLIFYIYTHTKNCMIPIPISWRKYDFIHLKFLKDLT
jgi:hypothetical protein